MPDTAPPVSPICDAPIDPATERAFRRYSEGAMVFHWITAVLMFATLPIAWAMVSMPRDDPARPVWFMIHKSIGITIFAVVLLRILWRALVRPPALAGRLPAWEAWTARVNHVLLYAILIVMPVSGYIGGRAPMFFGLFQLPVVTEDKAFAHAAMTVHLVTQWVVYLVIALHLLGVVWHVAIRRDGTLERMLPRQTRA
ncbi:MAG TPA: cytochrome b [Acidisphaera sp.]|nr:cytochrome b [Acidisphaera sp.]